MRRRRGRGATRYVRGGFRCEPSTLRTGRHAAVRDAARSLGMKVGLMAPQGWKGEYDGWDPAEAWARTDRARAAGRSARLRVDLGLRPLPHRPAAVRRDHLRIVLRPRRAGDGDRARPSRSHGHLHRVPQPRAHREDVVDDRRHQRWSLRARDRCGLEGGGVAGLRLRLPDDSASGWARSVTTSRSSTRCSGPAARPIDGRVRARPRRDQHAQGAPGAAHPDHRRRERRAGHGRLRDPLRGRTELRLPRAPPRSRRGWSSVRARCEARAVTRDAPLLALHPRRGRCASRARRASTRIAAFAAIGLDRIVCFPTRWSPTTDAQASFAEDCRAAGVVLD